MNSNLTDSFSTGKKNWGWFITLTALAALLIDLGACLVFMVRLSRCEQAKASQWSTYAYPSPVDEKLAYSRRFMVDALGRVWVSIPPDGGLSMLNPTGIWTTYTTQNSALPAGEILALASDKEGQIAVMTREGLSTLRPDGVWSSVIEGAELGQIFADQFIDLFIAFGSQGDIWVNALTKVYKFQSDGSWTVYDYGYSQVLVDVDEQGTVWLGGDFAGLTRLDKTGQLQFFPMPGKEGLEFIGDAIQDMAFDQQGRLWVAADLDGVFMVDPKGTWTSYTTYLGTSYLSPSSLYPFFLRYTYGPSDGKILRAENIAIDSQGDIWFTSNGFSVIVDGSHYSGGFDYDPANNGYNLSKLTPATGNLITYSSGLFDLPNLNDRIIGLGIDQRDRIWIAHLSGVTVVDDTSPFNPKSDLFIDLIIFSAGVFWTQLVALGLIMALALSFLSAKSVLKGNTIISFLLGFSGWFILNSISKYWMPIAYYLNLHFCPFYESGYPDCGILFVPGLILFFVMLNIGIPVFLFKRKKLGSMSGFITAFIINLIIYILLGHLESETPTPLYLMPLIPFFIQFHLY